MHISRDRICAEEWEVLLRELQTSLRKVYAVPKAVDGLRVIATEYRPDALVSISSLPQFGRSMLPAETLV